MSQMGGQDSFDRFIPLFRIKAGAVQGPWSLLRDSVLMEQARTPIADCSVSETVSPFSSNDWTVG